MTRGNRIIICAVFLIVAFTCMDASRVKEDRGGNRMEKMRKKNIEVLKRFERQADPDDDMTTESPDDQSTESPDDQSTEFPDDQSTEFPDDQSTETPGGRSTETPGGRRTETPDDQRTEFPDDQSTETPGGRRTETPDDQRTESPDDQRTETPGGRSTGSPGGQSTASPGGQSTASPGGQSTASPGGTENPDIDRLFKNIASGSGSDRKRPYSAQDELPDKTKISDLNEKYDIYPGANNLSLVVANKDNVVVLQGVSSVKNETLRDPYTIAEVIGYLYELKIWGEAGPPRGFTIELLGQPKPKLKSSRRKRFDGRYNNAKLVFKRRNKEHEFWEKVQKSD